MKVYEELFRFNALFQNGNIFRRESPNSCSCKARLCRQSRRASRTISLLEAYSPACTAPRTAWAISAVSVMVMCPMVL
jgi:hypothetical protein